jgi:hypothetical protein
MVSSGSLSRRVLRRVARRLGLVTALASMLGVLALAGGVAAAHGDSTTGPNLTGDWTITPSSGFATFEITSGTSTSIGGYFLTEGALDGSLSGTITDGQGIIVVDYSGSGATEQYVVTGLSGVTMTGFVFNLVTGTFPTSPPFGPYPTTIGQCQADTTDYAGCYAFTAQEPQYASVTVAMSPTVPPGGLGVGQSMTVPVTVTAGSEALTGVTLSSLTATGGAVKVTSTPTGTSGFALAAGASTSFSYQVTGTKVGTASLAISVSATGSGGGSAADSTSKTFPVTSRALVVTAAAQPSPVKLDVDSKGHLVPKVITVRVRVADTTKTRLRNVKLVSLDPAPADRTQQLDKLAFPKGSFPLKVGSIEGNSSFVKTLKLKVTGDGTYVLNYLATYDDPSQTGGNGKAVGRAGKFTVDIPLLYYTASVDPRDLEHSSGRDLVDGGDPWYVSGDIRNLSSFQTVCLLPLDGGFSGNANGLGPHQISVAPVNGPSPPMAGPITPGESAPFLMRVNTDPLAGPHSVVDLRPSATLGDAGDACNVLDAEKRPRIAEAKIVRANDSGPFNLQVRPSIAPNTPGTFDFFGEYAKGSYDSYASALNETLVFAQKYATLAALKSGVEAAAASHPLDAVASAVNSLDKTASVLAAFWLYAPASVREELLTKISDDFVDKTHQVWDGVQAQVSKDASEWFDHIVAAWYSGDTNDLLLALRGAGKSGKSINDFAISMAKFEVGLTLVKKTAALSKAFVTVAGRGAVFTRLADIPAGKLLTLDEMTKLWGLSKQDWEAFRKIAADEGVLIGVRGRAPISVKNLEDGAVWKHENLKPKNVSDIDYKYLGFSRSDNGLVAFRTYTPAERDSIIARIHNLSMSNAEKNEILARAETRFNEYQYLDKIEGFAKEGEIDVGINYQDNGIDRESASVYRKFSLESEKLKGGGVYYRPLQENPALDAIAKDGGTLPEWCRDIKGSALCRVTGDMDGVYIAAPDGTSLPLAKRVAVLDKLIAAGWQHPETLTWLKDPESFYFGAKDKILKAQELGGTPMIEFGLDPDKQFATYLDLKKSVLLDTDLFYLNVVGGASAR